MIQHLELHPHAYLDANNIVVGVYIFHYHYEDVINQVTDQIGAVDVKCCCIYGIASTGMEFYNNKFYQQKPFASWVRDEDNGVWKAPTPMPSSDPKNPKHYEWDEVSTSWVEITPAP